MDYAPGILSPFLATSKETLLPEALSTLRVMAFMDPNHLHKDFFESQRQLFAVKNQELEFRFPTTAAAHTKSCVELIKASLIQLTEDDQAFSMRLETQASVLADMHSTGLTSPLFNATVKVMTGVWPQMICIPDRTVDQAEFATATAPGTDYEGYLKKRHSEGQMPWLQEYFQYARVNVWGQRDELVSHIARLEHIFYHLNDDMIEECATITFAQLLAEAAWYFLERSRYYDAEVKIQAALGVYELARGKSPLHYASIHRVHAAIALERGKADEAAEYVNLQMEQLELRWLQQGEDLKESGLLDSAPDSVTMSPWGLDVPPGKFAVLPFRSLCGLGWKLYLSAQSEKDLRYPKCLSQAALCFSTVLEDRKDVVVEREQRDPRMGELLYSLGNVTQKQASFFGQPYLDESLGHYENALLHFQRAVLETRSAAGIAKTHYKLAIHFLRRHDYERATYYIDGATQLYASSAAYSPHFARLLFQRSKIQALTGDPSAKPTLHSAFAIRRRIRPYDNRFAEELTETDFDDLIGIWEK